MKRIVAILIMAVMIGSLASCSKESRAKNWGGSYTYKIAPDQKLVDVTWKDDDTWVLTKPMTATDIAETYTYVQEKGSVISVTGDGEITFVETKTK